MRILFVYPNINTELRIPLAVSILISCLRHAGIEVALFDTTFMGEFHTDNEAMERMGTHAITNLGVTSNSLVPRDELLKVLTNWKPDLICVSLIERNFKTAKDLLDGVNIPVLAGGILPTIAPEFCLKQSWIDYICVGEGEKAILHFLREPKNLYPKLINIDEVPEQDWSDFDDRHLLKPFMGRIYRGGAFEFSRGCFKSCSFCVAPQIRKAMKGCGKYHRTKNPFKIIEEIHLKAKQYKLEMISFGDTDFLANVPKDVMHKMLESYALNINLPFTIQSSAETLTDDKTLGLLKRAGCCAISVGVESGSERIRKSIIHKALPKTLFKKAFDKCREHGLRTTANYMVGLPTETEKDVQETIEFNKYLNPPSIAVCYFTPFMGTELYDLCVKDGLYEPFQENVYDYPPLKMPQLPQNRIKELVKEFTDAFATYKKEIE